MKHNTEDFQEKWRYPLTGRGAFKRIFLTVFFMPKS